MNNTTGWKELVNIEVREALQKIVDETGQGLESTVTHCDFADDLEAVTIMIRKSDGQDDLRFKDYYFNVTCMKK